MAILFTVTACGSLQAGQGGLVEDCQPCIFAIDSARMPYHFYFAIKAHGEQAFIIDQITVLRCDKDEPWQHLDIDHMAPVMKGDSYYFEAADINFDGCNDLLLVVERGVVNSYAKYWLFNPITEKFDYLDEYPILQIDTKRKLLSSYERGGHGGMIYQTKTYRFVGRRPELIKIEKQDWYAEKGIYVKIVQELQDGKLTTRNIQEVIPPPGR